MVEDTLLYSYGKLRMKKNLIDLLEDPAKQVLLFTLILFSNIVIAFALVMSPVTSIRGAEPNVIYTIQMTMLDKHWMYQDPESIPFSATQYMPLYYMICSSVASILSLMPGDEVVSIYQVSRGLSFLAAVLAGYFIYLTLYKVFDVNARWSYFTGFICILSTVPWYYAVRPDSLMALFFFSSLYCFVRYLKVDRSHFRYLVMSGALAACSFFSKQNGLIISAVVITYLMFHARIQDLGLFVFGFLLGALVLALVFLPFYTEFFFQHITQGLNNGIDVKTTIVAVYHNFVSRFGTLTMVTLLLTFIIISKISYQKISDQFKFLIYLFMISLPFSVATALKVGSDINYFHEVIATSFIILCTGSIMIGDIYRQLDRRLANLFVFCLSFSLAVSLTLSSFFAVGIRNIKRIASSDDVYKKDLLAFISEEATKYPGNFHLLSEEPFINNAFPAYTVLPHHDIASLWYTRKIYDFANLKKAVSQGLITLYIGNGDKLEPYEIDLQENFLLIKTIQGFKVYKNRKVAVSE